MSARPISGPIVGRAQELARFDEALARSEADAPVTLVLTGEAGIGKSRLLREFERRAREHGWRVISGDCIQVGSSGLPYGPIVDALGGFAAEIGESELQGLVERDQSPLGRLIPGLIEAGATSPGAGDSGAAQWRLFGSVLTLLERLGEERGVLFTIDDVQWADPSTGKLLRFLVAALRSPRIVIAIAARSGEGEGGGELLSILGELWRLPRVERIDVPEFNRAEVAAHLAALHGRAAERHDVDAMLTRSDGNPFYIEVLASVDPRDQDRLPATLKDVLVGRIRALDDDALAVVESAAIAGRLVDHDLLAAAVGLPADRLSAGLRGAIGSGVLEVDSTGERYRFHHALQQEAVYARVLPADRRRMHLTYARLLADRTGPPEAGRAAEIAHHLDSAREPMEAIPALVAAARAAIDLYAFHQALGEVERALALLDLYPDAAVTLDIDRVGLLEMAADAASSGGLADQGVTLGRRAVDLDDGSDPRRTASIHERLADYLVQVGQIDAGLAELRRAAALVEPISADPERARVAAATARTLMLASNLTDAVPMAEQAIEWARDGVAPEPEASALITLGVAQAGLGSLDAGLANLRSGLAIAEAAGASSEIARAYLNLNYALWSTGHVREALAVAQTGIRHAQSHGAEWSWGFTLGSALGELLYDIGRWPEAESMFHQAAESHASVTAEIDFRRSVAQLRIGQGRLREAQAEIDRMDELSESLALEEHSTWEGFLHASLAIWSGDWRAARAAVDSALARMPADDLPFEGPRLAALAVRADAELALVAGARRSSDRAAEARRNAATMVDLVERVSALPAARGNLRIAAQTALVRAEVARAEGIADADAWAAAASSFELIPMPFDAVYARMRLGEALVARREKARAAEVLRDAQRAATSLGAALLTREIVGLAARARIQLHSDEPLVAEPEPDGASPFGLTARELEVLSLLSEGRTNRQIASELFVSVKTASLHVSNILAKLEVTNRVEAAGMAHRLGLDSAKSRSG